MRNLGYALAAAIVILAPLSAWADQITENFSITVFPAVTLTGVDIFAGTDFPEFNPSLGTLDNIMTTLTGTATWTIISPLHHNLSSALVLHNTQVVVASSHSFSTPGIINIDVSGTDNFVPDLADLTGTGTTTLDLKLNSFSGDTFATSSSGLSGSITFNYTSAAAIPEPSSLALFGAGLVGFACLRRRKRFHHPAGGSLARKPGAIA